MASSARNAGPQGWTITIRVVPVFAGRAVLVVFADTFPGYAVMNLLNEAVLY